ncbi:uncharacterized protein PAC_12083 [Phialocephala subalpina]|uniref:2EXR domain-containing protein n=1 Tax=Phialocephala subalpina TaxID=576137 RepID=A0A1L7XB15_9HELO|nr:uncharacterized protein PAC_12083 [Phialocephala subalpina]
MAISMDQRSRATVIEKTTIVQPVTMTKAVLLRILANGTTIVDDTWAKKKESFQSFSKSVQLPNSGLDTGAATTSHASTTRYEKYLQQSDRNKTVPNLSFKQLKKRIMENFGGDTGAVKSREYDCEQTVEQVASCIRQSYGHRRKYTTFLKQDTAFLKKNIEDSIERLEVELKRQEEDEEKFKTWTDDQQFEGLPWQGAKLGEVLCQLRKRHDEAGNARISLKEIEMLNYDTEELAPLRPDRNESREEPKWRQYILGAVIWGIVVILVWLKQFRSLNVDLKKFARADQKKALRLGHSTPESASSAYFARITHTPPESPVKKRSNGRSNAFVSGREKDGVDPRFIIWSSALPDSRTLKLSSKGIKLRGQKHELLKAESVMPILLGACRDSPRIAQKTYKLWFLEHPNLRPQYLDMSRDILFVINIRSLHALLAPVYMIKEGEQSIQARLKHLMLGEDFFEPYRWDDVGYFFIRRFSGLKTLALEYDFSTHSSSEPDDSDTEEGETVESLVSRLVTKYKEARGAIWSERVECDSLPEIEFTTKTEMESKFLAEREGILYCGRTPTNRLQAG